MNPKVQELISKKQEEIKKEKLEKREHHLIKLGLTANTKRVYFDNWTNSPDCKYDEEKKKYYEETAGALEVSDEEYNEICKYFPEENDDEPTTESISNGAENTLKTTAGIILIIGVLSLFAGIIIVLAEELPIITLIDIVKFFLTTLISWAIMRCIANISITLKEIKSKIK